MNTNWFFDSITVIRANGETDSIESANSTPEQIMEFCERNLNKLNNK